MGIDSSTNQNIKVGGVHGPRLWCLTNPDGYSGYNLEKRSFCTSRLSEKSTQLI